MRFADTFYAVSVCDGFNATLSLKANGSFARLRQIRRFVPQIVAFGVIYCAQNALLCKRYVFANGFYEVLHILALRFVIHRAGIVHNGQFEAFYGGFYVVFLEIYKGANEGNARFVHIRRRRKARKSAFVKQG